ncbi:hypothetical protein NB644_09660 [Oxalobacter formigenes]|jgi:hypothetical protein|uniref:hypothetical protein n=1 Tax=Oxalobacter formigenes TaxID=847 RepID=UPI0022AF4CC7|nr:hypothetical protein [Oxalobacter formigenes]WAW01201.1 hypothetical protein NB644_09660 [Oxalobacter formigenes]WAW03529.1 hypothetical protein NB642_10430 [Oxalobacter formigenes]
MHQETIKECLGMSVYALTLAINHLERMKDANPAKKEAIQERIGSLASVMSTLLNESGKIGRLE